MAPQPFPAHRDRRPTGRQRCSAAANRCRNTASRRVLANRSAALRYPRRRRRDRPAVWVPSTGASWPGRSAHRASNTATAARRSATCAATPRIPNWYWSSAARVIAPAHRDDDTAVTACLRCARHTAWLWESTRPNRTRPASSPRYTDPSSAPIALSASASAAVARTRVRIRTPAGAAATTGSPIRRSRRPSAMHHILAATTDITRSPNPYRSLTLAINHSRSLSSQPLTTPLSIDAECTKVI